MGVHVYRRSNSVRHRQFRRCDCILGAETNKIALADAPNLLIASADFSASIVPIFLQKVESRHRKTKATRNGFDPP
jgi:hypothetical protein